MIISTSRLSWRRSAVAAGACLVLFAACDGDPTATEAEPEAVWGQEGVIIHQMPPGFQLRTDSPDVLNNLGQVAGSVGGTNGGYEVAVYTPGAEEYQRYGTILRSSTAFAMNDQGDVVGYALGNFRGLTAFVMRNGAISELFPDDRMGSWAKTINGRGMIAGEHDQTGGFFYDGNTTHPVPFRGVASINEKGEIVGDGYVDGSEKRRAVLFRDGTLTDLGSFRTTPHEGFSESSAHAINDHGLIVGASLTDDDAFLAYVWDGKMNVLPNLGSPYTDAVDVDNEGRIVGTITESANVSRGVLWTPSADGYVVTPLEDLVNGGPAQSGWYITDTFAISDDGRFIFARAEGGIVGGEVELWRGLVVLEEVRGG